MTETWKSVDGYSKYQVSSYGRIFNLDTEDFMSLSKTSDGYLKVSLVSDQDRRRHTCSVAPLVAEAFVLPPDLTEWHMSVCDHVVVLDGNLTNLRAENLVWRPRWFAFLYRAQLTNPQPIHFHNLRIINLTNGVEYPNIISAGKSLGLLFRDIWKSTYSATEDSKAVFPTWDTFQVVGGAFE